MSRISDTFPSNTMLQEKKSVEAHFVAKEDMVFAGKEIINQGLKECFIISL